MSKSELIQKIAEQHPNNMTRVESVDGVRWPARPFLGTGDPRPDQVKLIAKRVGVPERDVIQMNRRLGGDASLNSPVREDGDSSEWQDWLVGDTLSQETVLAETEDFDIRRRALGEALPVLSGRERRIFEAAVSPMSRSRSRASRRNLESLASGCARSRCARSRRCGMLSGVRSRPRSPGKHRRRTGNRFRFQIPATLSEPEKRLESSNRFKCASVIALRSRPEPVCAGWLPRLWL
jgi:hypothetical protein